MAASMLKLLAAALFSTQVTDVMAECMCGPDHPYCFGQDQSCYKDPNSKDWDKSTCSGTCTTDYTSNPKEYHYNQAPAPEHISQPRPVQHITEQPQKPELTQADVDKAVQEEKDALKDAWQAVTDTQAYSDWLYNGGNTAQYKEGIAEQIKTKAFARVDELRHRVEMNLSSKVTAVSALSAKLATEPGGGTPSEQAQLTELLSDVEKDRNRLKEFGLGRKIEEMQTVWSEAEEKEQQRMAMLRFRNLESRKFFLRSTKYADHVQKHWGTYEDICYGNCEEIFDNLESTVEPVQDTAKDQISSVYEDVYARVKHRVELLRKAAAGSGGSESFFLYA